MDSTTTTTPPTQPSQLTQPTQSAQPIQSTHQDRGPPASSGLQYFHADLRQKQTWKPSPDLFLLAAEFLQVAPERCAVVEDSGSGIEAGLAAGMQVFVFDPHEVHGADHRITAVRCLTDLIPALCD